MHPYKSQVLKVTAVYLLIAFLFGISVPILYGVRRITIETTRQNYNTTVINITAFETIPGTCTYCETSGGLGNLGNTDCYSYDGCFAYAIVYYSVWQNGRSVLYKGSTDKGMWCAATIGVAVNIAERYYGPIGTTYNGYYLLDNPTEWYWYIPGHDTYLFLIIMAGALGGFTLLALSFHLCCICSERKKFYTPIEELLA